MTIQTVAAIQQWLKNHCRQPLIWEILSWSWARRRWSWSCHGFGSHVLDNIPAPSKTYSRPPMTESRKCAVCNRTSSVSRPFLYLDRVPDRDFPLSDFLSDFNNFGAFLSSFFDRQSRHTDDRLRHIIIGLVSFGVSTKKAYLGFIYRNGVLPMFVVINSDCNKKKQCCCCYRYCYLNAIQW